MVSESAMPENSLTPETSSDHIDSSESATTAQQLQAPAISSEQNQQRLQKIEELIQSGDNTSAKNQADAISFNDLTSAQQNQLNLLNAQILLGLGDPEMAIQSLATLPVEQLDNSHKIEYLQSQAFAASLTGNALDSAKFRIELNELLPTPEQRETNRAAILESLALLTDSELESAQSSASEAFTGWLSLAKVFKLKGQPFFNERIAQWRASFPGHPGNAAALDNPQSTTTDSAGQPESIAFLLPDTGTFSQAAKAIRSGFMAAYNAPENQSYKPHIQFYDTEQATALFLYNQAINDGAQFVIGPLQKEALQSMSNSVSFHQPVLALNHIPGLEKENLYQFGLTPIDDVEAITRKASQDGHQKAVLMAPDNSQGQRISSFFSKYWQDVGGEILETQTYNPRETDFSDTIKKLLNLDESEYRYQQIQQLVPEIKFTPRSRKDVDVLFLNSNSIEGRSINPQLHYYQSKALPTYATSSIYSGKTNSSLDFDLNGITFCEAPWLLDNAYLGALSKDALKEAWQPFPEAYLRLFAMGIDTYQLINRVKTLETFSFDGATGKLSLVADNRIKRTLTCTEFFNGEPKLGHINTSAEPIINNITAPETVNEVQPMPEQQPQSDHLAQ